MSPPSEVGSVVIHTQMLPDPLIHAEIAESAGWRVMGLRMLDRSKAIAPGGMGKSMFARFVFGPDGRLEIGSKRTVEGNQSLLALIELGTKPHYIPGGAPDNPQGGPLAFNWAKGGGDVVFAWVHHPGTKKNPFVQKAMQQIVHEAAGLTLVSV